METTTAFEHRCTCGKLLHKGIIVSGIVSVKCKRCGHMNHFYGMGALSQDSGQEYVCMHEPLPSLRILDASPSMCTILGFSREELRTMTVSDIDPMVKGGSFDHLSHIPGSQPKHGFIVDTVNVHKDGTSMPMRVHALFGEVDGTEYVLARAVRLNNTNDTESVARAGDNRHFFSLTLSPDGTIVFVSKEVANVLGYESHELVGTFFFDLHTEEWGERCFTAFKEAAQIEALFYRAPEMICKDGRTVPIELYLKPRDDYFAAPLMYEGVCSMR